MSVRRFRGPERGDIYFGSGDEAGKLAGITKHPGSFFVLLPKGAAPAVAVAPDEAKEKAVGTRSGDFATGSIFSRADP